MPRSEPPPLATAASMAERRVLLVSRRLASGPARARFGFGGGDRESRLRVACVLQKKGREGRGARLESAKSFAEWLRVRWTAAVKERGRRVAALDARRR